MSITKESATGAVDALAGLPYFPKEQAARTMIADVLLRMCSDREQLKWLVRRIYDLWQKWEGPRELRAVFCSKYRPADGIDVSSEVFIDGVPSEVPTLVALPAPLPIGQIASGDAEFDAAIQKLAADKRLKKLTSGGASC